MTYYKHKISSSSRRGFKRKPATGRGWGYALLVVTTVLVYLLNKPIGALPAIGKLVDPVNGCWANAEATHNDFSGTQHLTPLYGNATVWFDKRLVSHIHAENEHDVFFLQGYVHAYFRLWQMDMQTRAAAGRVSEVAGDKAFAFDRKQRRKGMVYAAENSLKAAEAEPRTKLMLDAYTEGVNSFISSLNFRNYPLEYKLMGFKPEPWTNLKSTLLLKYMADDLTGKTDDIAHSYLRSILPKEDFELLYPNKIDGSATVIPAGTVFDTPSLSRPVAPPDSIAFPRYTTADFSEPREDGKGSNNWALSGARTASGAAILCNDPHLNLNLPSLWYEVQLQAPGINVYGASLPGSPGVVIGFNDSMTWGLTNNYRDVKDFYEIKPVAGTTDKYWFGGRQMNFTTRVERIAVKGKPDFIDTVRYTIHGPVMYDAKYNESNRLNKPLAVCWTGHRGSNEQLAIYQLNKAKSYNDFVEAILHFECPGQNMLYADRAGNIALWGQGQFINKWENQGRFVMNGWDSSTLWKELIPMRENPHVLNPQQGFLSSANECVTDNTYPYWYNGDFIELRSWRIYQVLANTRKATIKDMFALQNDTYSILASEVLPMMLAYSGGMQDKYIELLRKWDYRLSAQSEAATVFQLWWNNLYSDIWRDEFSAVPGFVIPLPERTMQLMLTDTTLVYYDNRRTQQTETLRDMVMRSYYETADSLHKQEKILGLQWYKSKNTSVNHLAKLPAFSYTSLQTGGWGNTVNAMKGNHGPSWRMVVQMGKEIEAYGLYPGGQSGNPGSKHYADFLQSWADGRYYRLIFLPNTPTQNNGNIAYTWNALPK